MWANTCWGFLAAALALGLAAFMLNPEQLWARPLLVVAMAVCIVASIFCFLWPLLKNIWSPIKIAETQIEYDVFLYDAICRIHLGKWKKITIIDGHLAIDGAGFQTIRDLLERIRQLAFDGRFPIWGKKPGFWSLLEQPPPGFWQHHQINYFSFLDANPKKLHAVPLYMSGQAIALRELKTNRARVDDLCRSDAFRSP
jgi:hypothetical protein